MKNTSNLQQESASSWLKKLEEADFSSLELSRYHADYIHRLQAHFKHYFSIYEREFACLFQNHSEAEIKNACNQDYFIDYGGGCGFLSLYAFAIMGIKKIIYVDTNKNSAKVTAQIFDYFALPKPIIIIGNQNTLISYCKNEKISPKYLISTDVIEHIYNLEIFFKEIGASFPQLEMVFSTGSNPKNPYVRKKLEAYMVADELRGDEHHKAFLAQRKNYIERHFEFSPYESLQLAIRTRGLIFEDIHASAEHYQKTGMLPDESQDLYECCDPNTGSWTERILSFKQYKRLVHKYGFKISFLKGYYDENRNSGTTSLFFKLLNVCIRLCGFLGYFIAPYIYLKISPKQ